MDKKWKSLIVSFLIVFAFAGVASFLTATDTDWYTSLEKPFFQPAPWLFGLMWPILYTLMAISLWLVWEKRNKKNINMAITSFFVQLILNLLWALLFFRLNLAFIGLIEIVFLEVAIAFMIYEFHKIDIKAAALQIPYFLWIAFGIAMNFGIFVLN